MYPARSQWQPNLMIVGIPRRRGLQLRNLPGHQHVNARVADHADRGSDHPSAAAAARQTEAGIAVGLPLALNIARKYDGCSHGDLILSIVCGPQPAFLRWPYHPPRFAAWGGNFSTLYPAPRLCNIACTRPLVQLILGQQHGKVLSGRFLGRFLPRLECRGCGSCRAGLFSWQCRTWSRITASNPSRRFC